MEQGLQKMDDNPYLMKRQSLDYISVTDGHIAALSIKACALGTFAWYVKVKQKILRTLSVFG